MITQIDLAKTLILFSNVNVHQNMILVNRQLNQKLFLQNQKKKVSMTTQTKIETKIKY